MDPTVLHNLTYGMYIVSSCKEGRLNGQIANTAFQITNEPVTIAISINKNNLTHEFIETSRVFSISVLEEDTPLPFIGKFGFKTGRKEEKFKELNYKILGSGCPVILDNCLCYLEAKVTGRLDSSTHTVFLGEVVGSEMLKMGKPMTYNYYHTVKRGTTPRTAPTFIKGEVLDKGA